MSKVVTLFTEEKKLIGHLLFASDVPIFRQLGWEGHCIFTGVPKDTETFDSPSCQYLQENKHIEFNAKIVACSSGYTIHIPRLLSATLSRDLEGTWSVESTELKGVCFVAAATS